MNQSVPQDMRWHTHIQTRIQTHRHAHCKRPHEQEDAFSKESYGVATISRLLKTIGLFCKRALQKRLHSAQETYNFKEPTNRSHPIAL